MYLSGPLLLVFVLVELFTEIMGDVANTLFGLKTIPFRKIVFNIFCN